MRKELQQKATSLRNELRKHFKGSDEIVDTFLAGVFSKSNILLWGGAGKGKSLLAEATANIAGTSYSRVQGSSGLTESKLLARYDVGKLLKGEELVKWRNFITARIKLFDELNRAHPSVTNSIFTMLAEKMVIFGDDRVPVPEGIFIASMNPSDSGCYELPYPLLDRFDICILLPSVKFSDKLEILRNQKSIIQKIFDEQTFLKIWEDVETVEVPRGIMSLLISLVRDLQLCDLGEKEHLTNHPECCKGCKMCEYICVKLDNRFPISERTYLSVAKVAKAYAYLQGRDIVTKEDVFTLFKYSLFHRAKFTPLWTEKWANHQRAVEKIVELLIDKNREREDAWKLIKDIIETEDESKLKELGGWWIDNDLLIKEIYEELNEKFRNKKERIASTLADKPPEELQAIIDSPTASNDLKKEALELLQLHLTTSYEIPIKKYPSFLSKIGRVSEPVTKYLRGYFANGAGIPTGDLTHLDKEKFDKFIIIKTDEPEEAIEFDIQSKKLETENWLEQIFSELKAKRLKGR